MPTVPVGPYPTVESVMNLARATINDMLRSSAGSILTDQAPFSLEFVNAAVDQCQEYLAVNGLTTNIVDNFVVTPLTAAASSDPETQVFLGYQGYNDGVVMHAAPVLPPDLIVPLRVWQRQTGSGGNFSPLYPSKDGLDSGILGNYFRNWEWRQGAIYLQGCTSSMDLRLRYEQSLGDIIATNPSTFSTTTINIPRCKRAVAYLSAYQYAISRGSPQAPMVMQMATDAMDQIINRQVRLDQRNPIRPCGYSSGDAIDGSLGGSYK
jgi:hypothetical protein